VGKLQGRLGLIMPDVHATAHCSTTQAVYAHDNSSKCLPLVQVGLHTCS
jgi:hypothetical protein